MSDNDALPFEEFSADSAVRQADLFDYGPSDFDSDPIRSLESLQQPAADPAEVSRLRTLHEDLIEAVYTAVNLTVRDDLMAELRSVRERMVALVGSTDGLDPLPADDQAQSVGRDLWDSPETPNLVGGGALVPVAVPGYDPETAPSRSSSFPARQVVPLVLATLAGIGLLGFALFGGDEGETANEADTVALSDAPDPAGATASGAALTTVRSTITGMGYQSVSADERDGVVYLTGSVPDAASRDQVISAARAVAAGTAVEAEGLVVETEVVDRPAAASLQRELDRLLGATPIIFAAGEVTLSERHQRILNNAVPALVDNPTLTVEVVGFTDGAGDAEVNLRLSQSRAQNVVAYLQSQGVPASQLESRAAGEAGSSGSADLQSLERRVELQVRESGPSITPGADLELGIALIAPSAANDLSATQSMADALASLAGGGGSSPISVRIIENVVDSASAEAVMIEQAESGARLIVAHGLQFGAAVASVAGRYPAVTFAWGTGSDTFGLPNVYAYNAAAEEGGFVLGSLAALLTSSGTVGFVGPLEAGDASRYANGFSLGASAQRPGTTVAVDFTGSFSEVGLAAEAARAQIENGADALTGTSPLVVGAVDAAVQANALWFGNEADQAPLAPTQVVASQVYDWSVVLDIIVAEIQSGTPQGRGLTIDMANGGLSIVFNPGFALDPTVRAQVDQLVVDVTTGVINPVG